MALRTLSGKHTDPRKGRGAAINPEGRFEKVEREAFDDGWAQDDAEDAPALKTQVIEERAASIISRNQSPDIPFTQSINPYQGCEHGCIYCLSGDTRILMADGSLRPLAKIHVGDEIYGTVRRGWYRRYVKTKVIAHWSVSKRAYRISLEDGTLLTAGADHRFLTERGWKFVADTVLGTGPQRPHLTVNNKLMGTGDFALPSVKDRNYRRGYLCGMIRGDGMLASYHYQRAGRVHGDQHHFRLALCDVEALQRVREYLQGWRIEVGEFVFQRPTSLRKILYAIRTHARADVERIRDIIAWPSVPSPEWMSGFLAGIFDAEGSYSQGILRITNTDKDIIAWIVRSLKTFHFRFAREHTGRDRIKPVVVVRLTGGLREHLRFFHSVDSVIARKKDIAGQAVKSNARLGIAKIEPAGKKLRLYDITTGTGDFIANGVVSHNCYARPTHAYRNLSPGVDFETRIFAKVNAAELLRQELSKPGYRCEVISLGANTDPYQPAERKLNITRGILEVCAEFNQPLGIITKNALVERDLDILVPMARKNLVNVHLSVNSLDHEIARRLEPRCVAPQRRIETIRALAQAGVPVGVLVAPVIPFLTDDQIETVLEAAFAAGATQAGYVVLRLPYEVKTLFRDWLERHYPLKAKHVMSRVHELRGGRDNDPNFGSRMRGQGEFAELLAQRFKIAKRRIGYDARGRMLRNVSLDTTLFRVPASGAAKQLSLF